MISGFDVKYERAMKKLAKDHSLNYESFANLFFNDDEFKSLVHDTALDFKAEAETKGEFGLELADHLYSAAVAIMKEKKWLP